MSPKKSIFISHSEPGPAELLESLLRDLYGQAIDVFNSTRASSGLAAGEPIDQGILARIESAAAMIWLATPHSVGNSFWMSWELGVASAKKIRTIPCTCLGLPQTSLPLLQDGRNAPDLGDAQQLAAMLSALGANLGLDDADVMESVDRLLPTKARSQFWGRESPQAIALRALGDRLLVTNTSEDTVRIAAAEERSVGGEKSVEILRGMTLEPAGRRVVANAESLGRNSTVYLEWKDQGGARFFSSAGVRGD
ncbi:MAG: hypothetical protein LBJ02_12035 [Bifidobacteriaceae bacterium]|jgi:hypothetical protein|nr:hypothetical protein [Bifidobacteriaceae bacterium]